jgi:hypothetical protein
MMKRLRKHSLAPMKISSLVRHIAFLFLHTSLILTQIRRIPVTHQVVLL